MQIGDKVICTESLVVGHIIKFYTPTACEEQIMVKTEDGRKYHAPVSWWRPYDNYTIDELCDGLMLDFSKSKNIGVMCGIDIDGDKLLNPLGKYVIEFTRNHNLTINEALERPICKARTKYFNETGR